MQITSVGSFLSWSLRPADADLDDAVPSMFSGSQCTLCLNMKAFYQGLFSEPMKSLISHVATISGWSCIKCWVSLPSSQKAPLMFNASSHTFPGSPIAAISPGDVHPMWGFGDSLFSWWRVISLVSFRWFIIYPKMPVAQRFHLFFDAAISSFAPENRNDWPGLEFHSRFHCVVASLG